MWVVYRKEDKAIVGTTPAGGQEIDKKAAIEMIVNGLASAGSIDQFDALQVKDQEKALKVLDSMMNRTAKVAENRGLLDVVDDDSTDVFLSVTVEGAQGNHPVDQVPLLQANPSSFVTIKLQKLDARGKPLTRKTVDKDVLWLRTDYGFLRADSGAGGTTTSPGMMPPDVRSVTLGSGTASFRLYAETVQRLATVQILSTNASLNAAVQVEFVFDLNAR